MKILIFILLLSTSVFSQIQGWQLYPSAKDTIRAIVSDSLATATNYDSVRAIVSDSISGVTTATETRGIVNDSLSAYFPVTNANLSGSITDSKLNQITTADKVAGSAVQLNATGGITNSTGLKITPDGSTLELNSNTLRMKDAGTTWDKLNTATKDSIRAHSAGTVNITNNADDTTTVEIGGNIKIKDDAIRYKNFSGFATGKTKSNTYRSVMQAIKYVNLMGFDTSYVYKPRNIYRNDGTYGYKIYLDKMLKTGGSWTALTPSSTSTVTENSDGITYLTVYFDIYGSANFGINYNELPAGTSINLATIGTYVFNDDVVNQIDSKKLKDEHLQYQSMTYISGQTASSNYYIIARAIKKAMFYNFDTSYQYKIRNFYRDDVTYDYRIYLEKRKPGGSWTAVNCDSSKYDFTENTTGLSYLRTYYSETRKDEYIDWQIDYREFSSGTSFSFLTTTGNMIFRDECFLNSYTNIQRKNESYNKLNKALGATYQANGDSGKNVFGAIMEHEGKDWKVVLPMTMKPERHSLNDSRKYIAVGWADLFDEDFDYIAPILAKYRVTNSFYVQERPFDYDFMASTYGYDRIQIILSGGNDLQNHSFGHFSPAYVYPLYDGYNIPSNYNVRHDYGGGLNLMGADITELVSATLPGTYWYYGYPTVNDWYENAWEDLTDGACDSLRMSLSIFRRPRLYYQGSYTRLLEVLDFMSNRYLGTTGYGRKPVGGVNNPTLDAWGYPTYTDSANWNIDSSYIAGGIFQGSATTQNQEIWERLLQIEELWQSEMSEYPVNYTHYSNPGGPGAELFFYNGSIGYMDTSLTDTASIYTNIYSSLTGSSRSFYDVLKSFEIKTTMLAGLDTDHSDGRTLRQYHNPLKLNSKLFGKESDLDMGIETQVFGRYLRSPRLTTAEWDSVVNQDSVMSWMYAREYDEVSPAAGGFYNMVNRVVKYTTWGMIPVYVDDSGQGTTLQKQDMALLVELRSMFCKAAGINEIGLQEAADIAFSQTVTQNVNFFPNPNFDLTINKVINPPSGYKQTIPDGWSGGTVAYNDTIGANVFTVSSGQTEYIRQYFIQPGISELKIKAQGNGKLKIYYLTNADPYTITTEPLLTNIDYDSVNIASSGTWTDYSLDINIPIAPTITSPDSSIACQGLDNQVCGLHIVLKGEGGNVKIASPRLRGN